MPAKNILQQALDGALSVRNALNSHLNRAFFVIAVLLFPDMEPDPEIECWANTSRTNVMFGTHNLVERLMALNDVKAVRFPPSAEQIDEEVAFINVGRRPEDNPVPVPGDGAMGPHRPAGGDPARRNPQPLHYPAAAPGSPPGSCKWRRGRGSRGGHRLGRRSSAR